MKVLALSALAVSLVSPGPARAEVAIDPQFVVDRVLSEGRDARRIELEAQAAYTGFYNNFANYDFKLSGTASYEDSRKQTLAGSGNLRDRTSIWEIAVEKRLPTGTTIGLEFDRTMQNSTYRPGSSSSRSSYAVYDVGTLTVTQDLLGNFFGIAERQQNRAAHALLAASELQKKEKQEQLVLDALSLFWDTFVARESLREAIAQRDKYEALVKEVENKSRLGFASPGDLPKSRAEFAMQVRQVKAASFVYLSRLDSLLTAMRMQDSPDRDIRFTLKEEMPPVPAMIMPAVEDLRVIQVAQTQLDSANLLKRSTDLSSDWPTLQLTGKTTLTGLEPTQSRSFATMTSGRNPVHYVALTMDYRFFSDLKKANKNEAGVNLELRYNEFLQSRETLRQTIGTAMENVRYTYAAALTATDELKQWEAAIKAQENSYRQGRLDFSQFIQDYNRYFVSRSTRLRAIGNYHIALHSYAAAVDQLVK